jgi:hypothetical protein
VLTGDLGLVEITYRASNDLQATSPPPTSLARG